MSKKGFIKNYTPKKHKTHLSNDYASLEWLEGEELKYISGLKVYAEPKSVRLIKDYGETILIEMQFVKSIWDDGISKPRYVRQAIPKAALAIEEVKFSCAASGEPIYGRYISDRVSDAEAFIPTTLSAKYSCQLIQKRNKYV